MTIGFSRTVLPLLQGNVLGVAVRVREYLVTVFTSFASGGARVLRAEVARLQGNITASEA